MLIAWMLTERMLIARSRSQHYQFTIAHIEFKISTKLFPYFRTMKVLVVEDEKELAGSIMQYLSEQGYQVEWAENVQKAEEKISSYTYDCILLDITLPDGNGLALLRLLKTLQNDAGLLIISAKNALDDKITGLELGADDYLTKPFHLAELAARIFSIIRRKQLGNSNVLEQDNLVVDVLAKLVRVGDNELNLTKTEFDLLLFFMGNKNKVLSKSSIAEHLSGDFADMFDNHDFIYAHIKNLKKKLSDAGAVNYIKTIYGTGYKWTV